MNKIIYFVTTNSNKYIEYDEFFSTQNIRLFQYDAELVEPQVVDSFEIIHHKMQQAKSLLPNKAILVDDRGFNVPALNGFPGPMLKLMLSTIGIEGLHRPMIGQEDRRAHFITMIGYYDGRDEHYFSSEEDGFLTASPRGDNVHGWTELLRMYGHVSAPGKSLAELTEPQWNNYLNVIESTNVLTQMMKAL